MFNNPSLPPKDKEEEFDVQQADVVQPRWLSKDEWLVIGEHLSHKEFGRMILSSRTLFFNQSLYQEYERRKKLQLRIDARRAYHRQLKEMAQESHYILEDRNDNVDIALCLYGLYEKNGYESSEQLKALCYKVVTHITSSEPDKRWEYIPDENIAVEGEVSEDKWDPELARALNKPYRIIVSEKRQKEMILQCVNFPLLTDDFVLENVAQISSMTSDVAVEARKQFRKNLGLAMFRLLGLAYGGGITIVSLCLIGSVPSAIWKIGLGVGIPAFVSFGLWSLEEYTKALSRILAKCKRVPEENLVADDLEAQRESLLQANPVQDNSNADDAMEEEDVNPYVSYQAPDLLVVINGEDIFDTKEKDSVASNRRLTSG